MEADEKSMKFYSEKDYQDEQISSFISFPLTREGWDEYLEFMREIEVDYEEQARKSLAYQREELLKALPAGMHPYIVDGSINQPYTPPELAELIADWNNELHDRLREQGLAARAAYESIKDRLPAAAVELWEHSLHDARFVSCEVLPDAQIVLIVEKTSGTSDGVSAVRLTFSGVRSANIPDDLPQADWYAEEFELSDAGFVISILLAKTHRDAAEQFLELNIEAEHLKLEWEIPGNPTEPEGE